LFAIVAFPLVKAFVFGAAEYAATLALAAAYNVNWRFDSLPVENAKCRVAPGLDEYNVSLDDFLANSRIAPRSEFSKLQRVSATAAVFRNIHTDSPEILLLQSAKWLLPGRAKWEMSGGAVDRYPRETLLRAAEREAKEEAGIELDSIEAVVGYYKFHCWWMLWTARNLKIMFLATVRGGDDGLKNIKLSPLEHQAFCWATRDQLAQMAVRTVDDAGPLKMNGFEAEPQPHQWASMQYISEDGRECALKAFVALSKFKEGKQGVELLQYNVLDKL
jgi:8-oxo-dGTP pyrophosphatase MutT (NUDIX family)